MSKELGTFTIRWSEKLGMYIAYSKQYKKSFNHKCILKVIDKIINYERMFAKYIG